MLMVLMVCVVSGVVIGLPVARFVARTVGL